jgi:DNA processing protein
MGGVTGRQTPVDEDVLLARAALSRVAEPANLHVWGCVREHGPVEAMQLILSGAVSKEVADATSARAGSVDPRRDLDAAEGYGIRLVVPESDEWPHFAFACLERSGLSRLATYAGGVRERWEGGEPVPPLALWVKGALTVESLAVRSVGIVGSRSATPYGSQVATELGYGLGLRGFTVVSGGAYGIDSAAHRGALAAGGSTVLVSAGGLDRPYPPSSANLYAEAAEMGALVSESPPGSAPHRGRFLTRNRLIAALSTGTVVVEAAARSGALNTAKHCGRLGRPLMAVPGPVTSVMSEGCHSLLRAEPRQAALVASVNDVVELIGGLGEAVPSDAGKVGSSSRRDLLDTLDADSRQVFDGFPARDSVGPDELAIACGLPPLRVIRALPALELAGLIEPTRTGYRIARR